MNFNDIIFDESNDHNIALAYASSTFAADKAPSVKGFYSFLSAINCAYAGLKHERDQRAELEELRKKYEPHTPSKSTVRICIDLSGDEGDILEGYAKEVNNLPEAARFASCNPHAVITIQRID